MSSVTQIIGKFDPASGFYGDESAMKFGTAVHRACEFYDKKTLNEKTLHKELVPYLNGWKKFLKDFNPAIIEIEKTLKNPLYDGTLDRILFCHDQGTIIADIKTYAPSKGSGGLQLGAYANLYGFTKIDKGYIITLVENDYKLGQIYTRRELRNHYQIWISSSR